MRTPRFSRPRSLRWRLTAWVAAVMLVAAVLVFVVVYVQTGASLQHQIDVDLRSDVTQMLQSLRAQPDLPAADLRAPATRYVRSQPFRATSTLLFVLLPGQPPASNHLELFGHPHPENGETAATQALENRESARLAAPRLGYSVINVPDVGHMRILEEATQVGSVRVVAGAGEPLGSVEAAQHSIARAFVLAGALALLLALLASYLAGARVTAPLRRMADVAARVDSGELDPRMEQPAGGGEEVRVLADSFNHMLDRLAVAFQTQREFMADASHELRTPLTVIRGQLEVLAAAEHPAPEEVRHVERMVQAEVTRMSRLVDDLLLLAAADRSDFLQLEAVELRGFITELWDGLSLTANRRFELGPVPEGMLRADPDRLAQAVRNLARNSIDYTEEGSGLVRLEVATRGSARLGFAVIDDGPGIPPHERQRVFERLYRTDPSRSRAAGGAGLGLSIVRAIVEAHGGEAHITSGPGGRGTRVEFVLPGFQPRMKAAAPPPALTPSRAGPPTGG
jgi:two-component system OmpR family sensor kinase